MDRALTGKINLAAVLVSFAITGLAMPTLASPEIDASAPASNAASGATQDSPHSGTSASQTGANAKQAVPEYLRTDDIPIEAERKIVPPDPLGQIVHVPGIENRVLSGDLDENYVDPFSDEYKQIVVPVIPGTRF